jgi:hypothetical protein
MAIMCVQCMLRALLANEPTPRFEGTVEQHFQQYHPDPIATQIEREELERQLAERSEEFEQKLAEGKIKIKLNRRLTPSACEDIKGQL